MNESIARIDARRHEVEEAYRDASQSWRDDTAVFYRRRFHETIVRAIECYSDALTKLDEALCRAEDATRN